MAARAPAGPRPAAEAAGMFMISLAVIALEVTVTRIFSFTIWYHYAFFVIAIGLLGLGASGVAASLLAPRLKGREPRAAAAGALLFAAGTWAALALARALPLDPLAFGRDPSQGLVLLLHVLALATPFLGAGFAVAVVLQTYSREVGRLYWADLAGAALGAVVPLFLLAPLGAPRLAAAGAALGALAALAFAGAGRRPFLIAAALLAAAVPLAPAALDVPLGPSKGIGEWLRTSPEARLAFTRWHPLARVDVVENTAAITWSLPAAGGEVPAEHQIIYDGDAATPILHIERPAAEYDFLGSIPAALPHAMLRPDSVLVIGVGGGIDVLAALHFGARFVEGVELNPVTKELMTGRYQSFSGHLYRDPRVHITVGEGRSFVRASRRRYDLIQMSLIDTFAATAAGAYSLSESYLYTVEACADFLDRLREGGVFAVTRFLHQPPREILRLCAVAQAALRGRGVADPAGHFLVAASGAYATVLVGTRPFSPEECRRFVETARSQEALLIYVPGAPVRNPIAELLAAPDPERLIAGYPLRIDPVTDDRPFFFQYGRFRDARPFQTGTTRDELVAPSGHSLLLTVLVVTGAVAAAMILLPLAVLGRRGARRPARADLLAVLYFVGLGLAFILVEIAAMQQFALVLGHPTTAVSVVLFSLLLASGTGSLVSGAVIGRDGRRLGPAIALVAIALLAEAALARPLFPLLLSWPWPWRVLAAVFWVALPGFGMGMFLPAGVRMLAARRADLVGWAFGANGFASVVGSVLSVLLSMLVGFRATVALAALTYAAAYLALRAAGRSSG